jgi:hypothetical protein
MHTVHQSLRQAQRGVNYCSLVTWCDVQGVGAVQLQQASQVQALWTGLLS